MTTHRNATTLRSPWLVVLVVVFVGAAAGVLKNTAVPASLQTASDINVDDPTNLSTMVAVSDIIVKAEVGPTAYQTVFAGYNAQGTLIAPVTQTPASGLATAMPAYKMPLTDFTINDIVQTLRDCDSVVATPGAVKVRMLGNPPSGANAIATDSASDYPIGQENDQRLFFLSKNPDNTTYGLYHGPCSRLTLDGDEVTCSDGSRRQLGFMDGLTVQQFINAVATEVAQQSCP
jgi:hypothetical protein